VSDVPNRWSDYLRRFFDQKGPFRPTIVTDVMPTVNLYEEAPHLFLLRDEHLIALHLTCTAGGAGTFGREQLGGPAKGSNNLLVITDVQCMKPTAGTVGFGFGTQAGLLALAPAGSTYWTADRRDLVPPNLSHYPETPAGLSGWVHPQVPGNVVTRLPVGPFILPPQVDPAGAFGQTFIMQNETANEAMDWFLLGYVVPTHGGEEQ
jgi:hypothetical protein